LRWVDERAWPAPTSLPATLDAAAPPPKEDQPLKDLFPTWLQDLSGSVFQAIAKYDAITDILASSAMSTSWGQRGGRWRDVYPLPLPSLDVVAALGEDLSAADGALALQWCVGCVRTLNAVAGYRAVCRPATASGAQRSMLRICVQKVLRFLRRLGLGEAPPDRDACRRKIFGIDGDTENGGLVAKDCDIYPNSGHLDPTPFLPDDIREVVTDPSKLFADGEPGSASIPCVRGADRKEYLKFVVRQLDAGKADLRVAVRGGAAWFGRRKPSGKTRPIYNGHNLSLAAARPPVPRHLASPSALLHLEAAQDDAYVVHKRDGTVMFDQLATPAAIQDFFGQPRTTLRELATVTGKSELWLRTAGRVSAGVAADQPLWPTLLVWGTGFAWSSAVCQEVSLKVVEEAGLPAACLLADDLPPPQDVSLAACVATDDIIVFRRKPSTDRPDMAGQLNQAFAQVGVERNPAKDVDEAQNVTVIGIDVYDGRYLGAHSNKITALLAGTTAWLERPVSRGSVVGSAPQVTPRQLMTWLGLPHWFCQLSRPLYSLFGAVYEITEDPAEHLERAVGDAALAEMIALLCLLPYAEADLTRTWAPAILASDASGDFGFGVSHASVSAAEARQIGLLSAQQDFFVELSEPLEVGRVPRVRRGRRHVLGLHPRAFRTVICKRAAFAAHSGTLEANAALLMCRWAARRPAYHRVRLAALIDAQAVLSALRKGRSSAPTLRLTLRRTAAYLLGTDVWLRPVYVPTEFNPADRPSRGSRGTPRSLRTVLKPYLERRREKR